jgi:predicted  nucleic acid-binding Zn-ribbon protein
MSYSSPNNRTSPQTPIYCTRCGQVFYTDNPFMMTCPACHQRDIDYTVRLGNQTRMFQIEVALMTIAIELSILKISDDRKLVLEKLVAQLEQEKQELSKNV